MSLEYGRVTDAVYKRSVDRPLRGWPLKAGCEAVNRGRDGGSIQMDGQSVCMASATKTGREHDTGACAVHQAVNQLMAAGGEPYSVSVQVLVPVHTEENILRQIHGFIAGACAGLQIAIGACDAMAVNGLSEFVVSATAIGRVGGCYEAVLPTAEQDIIMTGYAGWSGTVKLAMRYRQMLEAHFNPSFLSNIFDDNEDKRDCAAEAVRAAASAGVRTMYAAGAGGVFAAAWELAAQAGLGCRIHLKAIPLRQETVEICDYFGISPYQLVTEGALLLTADHGQKVLTELAAAGVPAVIIGHLTDDNDRVILSDGETRYLEPFRQDSIDCVRF